MKKTSQKLKILCFGKPKKSITFASSGNVENDLEKLKELKEEKESVDNNKNFDISAKNTEPEIDKVILKAAIEKGNAEYKEREANKLKNIKDEFFVDTPRGKLHIYTLDKIITLYDLAVIRGIKIEEAEPDSYMREICIDFINTAGIRKNLVSTTYDFFNSQEQDKSGNFIWRDMLTTFAYGEVSGIYSDREAEICHTFGQETPEKENLKEQINFSNEHLEQVKKMFTN